MHKITITSFLLSVFALPCFNQQITDNEILTNNTYIECPTGITNFNSICSIESLDSVIHFGFTNEANPNISSRIFYFDESDKLDSIEERFRDNLYNYTSGYTISYNYDESGRVSEVSKASWNSSIEHLAILTLEQYEYDDRHFRRFSNIEWRTAYDTSFVDVKEEYAYDEDSHLADYTLFVPEEINPDDAIYKEVYNYDSIGFLSYESKDLTESGESLNLIETKYQNSYLDQNLPWLIHASSRGNGQGAWEQSGSLKYFYDELDRKTLMAETKAMNSDPVYEQRSYTYDQFNHIITEVRYISTDSIQFQLADSIIYYHSLSEAEEEEEEKEEEEWEEEEFPETPETFEFKLFPNPTDGILHIRSGIDSPSTIRVIDASGKVVLSKNVLSGVMDIDLSPYPDGFYIVTLNSIGGYYTGKVFKY